MYPNQPQQQQNQPQFDNSYLDQIAAQPTQQTMSPLALWGIIGGILTVLIVIIFGISAIGGESSAERLETISERSAALKELTTEKASTIRSSELRATNSSLSTILTGISADLSTYVNPSGEEKKKDKNAPITPVAQEYTALETRLEDAELNVEFDQSYANELEFQITQLQSEMAVAYDEASDADIKNTLTTAYENLDGVLEGLQKVNNLV